MRRKKYLIGAILVFAAIGALTYNAFLGSSLYYYTVSELKAQNGLLQGQRVRLSGTVATASPDWDVKSMVMRFSVADEKASIPVVYKGLVPDTFKVGADVVVEGKYNSSGIFEANVLMTKCPSRYVPAD